MADLLKEDDESPKKGDELIIVEDDPAKSAAASDDDDDDADPRARADSADDEDPDSGDADEREEIRERRRQEKLDRKQRRGEAIKRDKVELDFLRKRNEDLERRLTAQEQRAQQQDLNAVDARLQQAMQDTKTAEAVIAKAVAAGNGEDVTQAMRYRDEAMARAQQLNALRQQQQSARSAPPPVDPAVLDHAQRFIQENTWYDPQGRDEDSSVVLAIDNALVRDGFDPRSADYWDELKRRAARRLPDKFKAAAPARTPRGGPAMGSGREHAPESTRREVYISPERKQALIDAGVWEDPVLRMKYVKRYADYDRSQRTGA